MSERTKIAEGKTKIIWDAGHGMVTVESKDDITAGDGASRDLLEGKALDSNLTTCHVFKLLEREAIPTHYLNHVDNWTFAAQRCQMIPIELVARRIATGSYLKRRPDVVEGTVFDPLVVEFFEKNDAAHDPLVVVDIVGNRLLRYQADKPLGEGFLGEQSFNETASSFKRDITELVLPLRDLTVRTFETIEGAWAVQDVQLVDLKIECGWYVGEDGESVLVVADVIDNDSWRIWPGGDRTQMKDKQVYRDLVGEADPKAKAKELGRIKDNYSWVAVRTKKFVEPAT